jgi:hypothetical protein
MNANLWITVLMLLMFLPGTAAQEKQQLYAITLQYDSGLVTIADVALVNGYYVPQKEPLNPSYELEFVSWNKSILHSVGFNFPLKAHLEPLAEWFDEDGRQIYIPTVNETIRRVDKAVISLLVPYFPDAAMAQVKDAQDIVVAEYDVSEFSLLCGNGVCEVSESYFECSLDCPSGGLDGVCDAVSDSICDPDCSVGDVDCAAADGGQESAAAGVLPLAAKVVIAGILLALFLLVMRARSKRSEF